MNRPEKKFPTPAVDGGVAGKYSIPYDDSDEERDRELPSLRTVAVQLGTTILRVRKLLITYDYFSIVVSRWVH